MKNKFLEHCIHPEIVKNGVKSALLVGVILAIINHFEDILTLSFSGIEILQIIITFLVPYSVSVYSAAKFAIHRDNIRGY